MKNVPLRSIGKINRNVVQNSCRLFSFKFEMTPANRLAPDQSEESKIAPPEEVPKPPAANFRYNVCQPRTSPVDKPRMGGDTVAKESVKAAIEEQHLQPAMLPEYFQKQMERNALINPEPDNTEEVRINSIQRRFQVSKTCANATLPLKSVKLANPFPEPVKMMNSRTVSDDEKAEQMLAESRSQRHFSDWSGKPPIRKFSSAVRRWYSKQVGPDPEKCKKLGKKTSTCPRMNLQNCPPRARFVCERQAKYIDCKKQEAPYPAYSEFCHEEIDEKPSECKICPWKADENPNFKPQKKKIHTSSAVTVNKRRGLEMNTAEIESYAEEGSIPAAEEDVEEGMLCDLRKPECERPKNRRCPPTKEERKKEEEEKRKKKEPKKECLTTEELLEECVLPAKQVHNLLSLRSVKDDHKNSCKIRKFKFPKCGPIQKRETVDDHGKCPKKKKPKIPDCPPDANKCDIGQQIVEEYKLSRGNSDDKRKCPDVDLTVNKEEDERCKPRKGPTTKICPGDLLKKKHRKPRKKTSGVLTPAESNVQLDQRPQPTKTI